MASLRWQEEMKLLDVSSARRQRTAVTAATMKKCEENCGQDAGTNSVGISRPRDEENRQDRAERFSSFWFNLRVPIPVIVPRPVKQNQNVPDRPHRHRHREKSWTWINRKYFRASGHRHWIFSGTLPDSKGKEVLIELMEANRVAIRRFVKIRAEANPYDPAWELYLEARLYWQLEGTLAGRGRIDYLWKAQGGRCVRCGQALRTSEKPWHIHHRRWRSHGGPDTVDNLELLHGHCHRQIHYGEDDDGPGRVSREASANARAG